MQTKALMPLRMLPDIVNVKTYDPLNIVGQMCEVSQEVVLPTADMYNSMGDDNRHQLKGDLLLLNCGHVFRKHCIDPWLARNAKCVVCRKKVIFARTYAKVEQEVQTISDVDPKPDYAVDNWIRINDVPTYEDTLRFWSEFFVKNVLPDEV